jgi:hypothetical protein
MESVILEYRIHKLELEINKIRIRIARQKNEFGIQYQTDLLHHLIRTQMELKKRLIAENTKATI